MDESCSETWKPDPDLIANQKANQREVENRWPTGIRWCCCLYPEKLTQRMLWPELIIKADTEADAKARYMEFYKIHREPPWGISVARVPDPT